MNNIDYTWLVKVIRKLKSFSGKYKVILYQLKQSFKKVKVKIAKRRV